MKHKATLTITFTTNDEEEWKDLLTFKDAIASGEFQRELSYHSHADRDNPAITPKIKVTATFKEE